jgi:hypothetical protein
MDRVVGLGLRTGRVKSQRRFAVGPEVRPYPGAEGQSPMAMGPWYKAASAAAPIYRVFSDGKLTKARCPPSRISVTRQP